ncbi:uncharacterized protein LOC118752628 [Rhagoletis pomonella]|uniref:uncharacterized protein LOC118752628 n=1 Tax=Rhagoletis pomonella TaxID=28610 RepID=UPI001786D247|nr:uncharacterized protein LOC118752628 [Rhagoletis pomonella]
MPSHRVGDSENEAVPGGVRVYGDNGPLISKVVKRERDKENPTERTNRSVKRIIAQLTGEQQRNWDDLLPEIMLALNTSVCDSTGYSPAFLTQGREPRLPRAVYDKTTFGTGQNSTTPNEKAATLKEVFSLVRQNQQRASAEQARHYNLRRRQWRPTIGDLVLLREHPQSTAVENFAAKLARNIAGRTW